MDGQIWFLVSHKYQSSEHYYDIIKVFGGLSSDQGFHIFVIL